MAKTFALIFGFIFCYSIIAAANNGGENAEKESSKKITATFSIASMHVSKDGMLHWTSTSEDGSLTYIVEQYIFDRWVKVAAIEGVGTSNANSYSCPVVFHNGENKFRVRQRGADKISRYSNAVSHQFKTDEVNYQIVNHNQLIEFSAETYYMIYNPYGEIIDHGYATTINISDYEKGRYCLVYDNKLDIFDKKKVILKNTIVAMAL